MAKPGKNYRAALEKVDLNKQYLPREGVALNQYVGQQVQLSAIMLDPDEKDAEVKIEDKVSVDPDNADSSTKRTKTEVEIERGAAGHYTVMTVKPMGGACK